VGETFILEKKSRFPGFARSPFCQS